ncbi:MAG: glycerate dehydrogenase [Candidatus Omnitrophica bacterium]|nr:glycerate dehydrogenase [Candidatus Omnitrophota bacterium]
MSKRKIIQEQIVFLDAGSVDFGDVLLEPLRKAGRLTVFQVTRPAEIFKRAKSADHVVVNKCRFDADLLKRLKNLKSIHLTATGTNNIDLVAAEKNRIAVTNVRDYCTDAVAQYTISAILNLAGNIFELDRRVRAGEWSRSRFFTVTPTGFQQVAGQTLGIIGYGAIGRRVARLARGLGMKIMIARIPGRCYSAGELKKRVLFSKVIRASDFMTIHAPLTKLTARLINRRVLHDMKPGSFLINTARGGIVHEKALDAALRSGRLGGAVLDVLEKEPPALNHPLLKTPRLILTPHASWSSLQARNRVIEEVALNIKAFCAHQKRNRVV